VGGTLGNGNDHLNSKIVSLEKLSLKAKTYVREHEKLGAIKDKGWMRLNGRYEPYKSI